MNNSSSNDSRLVVFADLDNTLFQTRPKRDVSGLTVAGLGADGQPLSFACPKQQKLLACLMREGIVIPTTARGYESFNRVQMAFDSFVILNFGATILNPDRTLNEEWHTIMAAKAQSGREALLEQFEALKEFNSRAALGLSISLVADFGEDWYILAKYKGDNAPALDFLEAALTRQTPEGFVVQRNDNNLTLSPEFLDKAHAVEFVVDRYFDAEKDVFLGMGDSLSDFNFMSSCDVLMLPSDSQLHKAYPRAVEIAEEAEPAVKDQPESIAVPEFLIRTLVCIFLFSAGFVFISVASYLPVGPNKLVAGFGGLAIGGGIACIPAQPNAFQMLGVGIIAASLFGIGYTFLFH